MRVRDGDRLTRPGEHRQIVRHVADRDDISRVDAKALGQQPHSGSFVDAAGGDFDEVTRRMRHLGTIADERGHAPEKVIEVELSMRDDELVHRRGRKLQRITDALVPGALVVQRIDANRIGCFSPELEPELEREDDAIDRLAAGPRSSAPVTAGSSGCPSTIARLSRSKTIAPFEQSANPVRPASAAMCTTRRAGRPVTIAKIQPADWTAAIDATVRDESVPSLRSSVPSRSQAIIPRCVVRRPHVGYTTNARLGSVRASSSSRSIG